MATINPAEDNDYKAEAVVVNGGNNSKSKQEHDAGVWLGLRRIDIVVKYLEFATLVTALVLNLSDTVWSKEKHLWWLIGGTVGLNVLVQSAHMFLYYIANRYAKDKYYWPRVFPKEWIPDDYGTGYSQHYKFFYLLKLLMVAYIGFMVFQEKLDGYFVYLTLFMVWLLIVFDLAYYLFELH